jgi:peroxiredoxin
MEVKKKIDYYSVFLHLMVVGLMIIVVILTLQNRELKKGGGKSDPDLLKFGDTVPAFSVISLDGIEQDINYTNRSKKTLLLIFNTTCPACLENSPNWMDIWKEHDSLKVNVIPVSLHKLERTIEYADKMALSYPVYVPKDSTLLKHYKLNAIPLTLMIGTDGNVEKNWAGILTPAQVDELKAKTEGR